MEQVPFLFTFAYKVLGMLGYAMPVVRPSSTFRRWPLRNVWHLWMPVAHASSSYRSIDGVGGAVLDHRALPAHDLHGAEESGGGEQT
jgi:hypothetical protein